jgi:SAM-dependent methyltransferase
MRSLAAWLWLVEFKTTARALDASDTPGDLALALKGHFHAVDVLRPDHSALERVKAMAENQGWTANSLTVGSIRAAPWPPETFDCIALHDTLVATSRGASDMLAVLTGLRPVLKPGGWLAVGSPNPRVLGGRRGGAHGIPCGRLARLLRRARFRDVRCQFVEPSLESPLTLVPDAIHAIDAHEAASVLHGSRAWARRTAARLGLRSMLYPAYFLLARA